MTDETSPRKQQARKSLLLRLDPSIHDALAKWAADDLRSLNAHIDYLLRRSLSDAGRLPERVPLPRRPGRPGRTESAPPESSTSGSTSSPAADDAES